MHKHLTILALIGSFLYTQLYTELIAETNKIQLTGLDEKTKVIYVPETESLYVYGTKEQHKKVEDQLFGPTYQLVVQTNKASHSYSFRLPSKQQELTKLPIAIPADRQQGCKDNVIIYKNYGFVLEAITTIDGHWLTIEQSFNNNGVIQGVRWEGPIKALLAGKARLSTGDNTVLISLTENK